MKTAAQSTLDYVDKGINQPLECWYKIDSNTSDQANSCEGKTPHKTTEHISLNDIPEVTKVQGKFKYPKIL